MTQSINSTLPPGYGKTILTADDFDTEVIAVSSFKATSAALGGSALNTFTGSASNNTTVTGATIGMSVIVTPAVLPGAGIDWKGYIPVNGIVQTIITNTSNANVTPNSTTFAIRVLP